MVGANLNNYNKLRLHCFCPNHKFKGQKQITVTPKQFQMDGAGFKKQWKQFSKVVRKLGTLFLKQQKTP